jgi:PEGA domain-containing protein
MPVFGAPPAAAPPVQTAPAPIAPIQPVHRPPAQPAPLRIKADTPPGYAPVRKRDSFAPPMHHVPQGPVTRDSDEPRAFPWKLAAAAIIIVAIAVVVGRAYMPSKSAPPPEEKAASEAATPAPPPAATPPSPGKGEIAIETQPAGAKVLLDGKPVGESPLKLTGIAPGRHVLTFITSSGEVTKTVRVSAGKTLSVDVPIFSGWVAIFAPIVLEISENGKSLGTTEVERIMLPPGQHELTLVNRDLGYKATQDVTIDPGEVKSITIEPKGTVSFNAVPWAEVWLDGQKLGDTPLANMRVPLGVREFVFKHPQYPERKIAATVRADEATTVSADFTRQQ